MFTRFRLAAAVGLFIATATPAFSQGTLRIGMTAADIPQTEKTAVELLEERPAPALGDGTVEAVDRHERFERAQAGRVRLVRVPRYVREEVVPGDVILVAVAVQHAVDARQRRPTRDHGEARVDDQRLVRPVNEQRVAVRILPVLGAEEHGAPAEDAIDELHRAVC